MYLYIYDTFLNDKKFNQILTKIESRLNDLDIKGKICRLNLLKNLREIIEDSVEGGVNTIVAVGDDTTFSKIINCVINQEVIIGYIPVNKKSKIAEILGIPINEQACDILAQRIIKKIDIARINNQYFVDSAEINPRLNRGQKIKIKFKNFEITPIKNNIIRFCNLGALADNQGYKCNPSDGYLETIITPISKKWLWQAKKIEKQSVFPFTKVKIMAVNNPIVIKVDEQSIIKTPAEIEIIPQKLKIIVGSQRKFD